MKYKYSDDNISFTEFSSQCEFKGKCNSTEDYIAEDAAKHRHEVGGKWPVDLTIKTMDNESVGSFTVIWKDNPKFIVRRKT